MDFAPGLPDDDVAILVARVTCVAVDAPGAPPVLGSLDEVRAFPSA